MIPFKRPQQYFHYFRFFYRYLGIKVFIGIILSLLMGVFDGVGLALFIPLIKLAFGESVETGTELDRYSQFLLENFQFDLNLRNVFLLILILFSLKGIFKFIDIFFRVWTQQIFMRKIRDRSIFLLSQYDYQHFVKADTGRIQNILGNEVNRVSLAYGRYFRTIHYFVLVAVYLVLAMYNSFWFSFIVLIGGVLLNLVFTFFYKRTKFYSAKFSSGSNEFQGLLMQKINSFHYLKATGKARAYAKRLKVKIKELEKYQLRLGIVEAFISGIREPFTILIVFAAIVIFIQFFESPFASILLSLLLLYRSITYYIAIQEQWNAFLGVSGSLQNLTSFLEELYQNPENSGSRDFFHFQQQLKLEGVQFAYEDSPPILNNISLQIKKNETVAIVGESGAGKSTLLNILAGILMPGKGSYLIDAVNFKEFKFDSFREKTGYIVQDPVIFNDTIFNNISFWDQKNDSNLERFRKICKKSAIDTFIQNLPQKEDTLLGYNGLNVSGGQKQRLAIARELYKDAEIIFMDEATSNLDSETENEIQTNLFSLKGEFTLVIVAHRLSTVKMADRIILLKKGEIAAIGDYRSLLESNEDFRKMVELQEL